MEKVRTFVAIEVPKTVRDLARELQKLLGPLPDGIKWTGTEQIHLTLKFLGDVEAARLDGVKESVKAAVANVKPFTLTSDRFGAFPSPAAPRVLWVGIEESEALADLYKRIETELAAAGFPREERHFSPHLTVGRIKTNETKRAVARGLKKLETPSPVSFDVASVVVFKSVLERGGALHTRLYGAPLLEQD